MTRSSSPSKRAVAAMTTTTTTSSYYHDEGPPPRRRRVSTPSLALLCLLQSTLPEVSAAFLGQATRRRRAFGLVVARQDFSSNFKEQMSFLSMSSSSSSPDEQPQAGEEKGKRTMRTSGGDANEWGIPSSSSLPPLYKATSPGKKAPSSLPNGGKVTMVGSGPGDPELLTVAAYKLLTENPNALVVADRLVSPEILNLIASSDVKVARKLPGCAELAQEEIYWWCYQGLNAGKHVIRLKIGDPFVFGRGGEEVLQFRNGFGVEPHVIPGVSAAFSAPLLGSIPVTHRGVSNQVVMCTGYGRNGTSPDLIRYHKEQTVVFLMAVGRLEELCRRLIDMAGYPTDTPVAIVEAAGCPHQRTVVGDMRTIGALAKQHAVKPPSTIVVGNVVNVLLDKNEETGHAVTGLIQNYTASIY